MCATDASTDRIVPLFAAASGTNHIYITKCSFPAKTEWSQKTAFDKEERDFKTNNPHSLTCIQIQTRETVVKNPKPLTFLLQAAFITERAVFILAGTYPFDSVFWITS